MQNITKRYSSNSFIHWILIWLVYLVLNKKRENKKAVVSDVVASVIYVKIISEKVMFYIYSGSTERFYNIRQHVNCESENVIYLVICKNFKIQYVGMLVLLPVNIRSDSVALLQNTRPFRGFRFFFFLHRLPFIGLWFVSYYFLSYFWAILKKIAHVSVVWAYESLWLCIFVSL